MAYLECARGLEGLGMEVPQWDPSASPGRGLEDQVPPEAEAFLVTNAYILMFWKKKLVNGKNTTIKIGSTKGKAQAQAPPQKKYAPHQINIH